MIYQIDHLRQIYTGRTVLDVERLDVQAGEILALVGPSGAGKSTLLRVLNFLEKPAAGEIVYRGSRASAGVSVQVRRQVTTVFQRPVLLRTSVRDDVAFGLHLRGERVDGRVTEMIARVGLEPFVDSPASRLSGGEMQRVALARALVVKPIALLLDEPTANLDPYNVGLIEVIVKEQNRERGTTVILVTHNAFQAKRMADRVGLLLSGRLVEVGSTAAFFDAPKDPRTAAFVRGEMVYQYGIKPSAGFGVRPRAILCGFTRSIAGSACRVLRGGQALQPKLSSIALRALDRK